MLMNTLRFDRAKARKLLKELDVNVTLPCVGRVLVIAVPRPWNTFKITNTGHDTLPFQIEVLA